MVEGDDARHHAIRFKARVIQSAAGCGNGFAFHFHAEATEKIMQRGAFFRVLDHRQQRVAAIDGVQHAELACHPAYCIGEGLAMFGALIDVHRAPRREGGFAGINGGLNIVGIAVRHIGQWLIVGGVQGGGAFAGTALHPLAANHHFPAVGFLLGYFQYFEGVGIGEGHLCS